MPVHLLRFQNKSNLLYSADAAARRKRACEAHSRVTVTRSSSRCPTAAIDVREDNMTDAEESTPAVKTTALTDLLSAPDARVYGDLWSCRLCSEDCVCDVHDGESRLICLQRGPAKKRILVVDDDEARLLATTRALQSKNNGNRFKDLVVEQARSGEECLDVMRDVAEGTRSLRDAPSVVLLSAEMMTRAGSNTTTSGKGGVKTTMSGVECCAEIRRRYGGTGMGEDLLHIIILTDPAFDAFDSCVSDEMLTHDLFDSCTDYEREKQLKALIAAGVTRTLPDDIPGADLLVAVEKALRYLPHAHV